MIDLLEGAALVALLRAGGRPWQQYAELVEEAGSANAILEQEQGLLATEHAEKATREIERWDSQGFKLTTVLDPDYPENLRAVHDRPPLIFVAGRLEPGDARSVAVVGSRNASERGGKGARAVAEHLVDNGYTVVSGLAAGIDTAAHIATLKRGGRTVAVIGTGLSRSYPPQNAALQKTIIEAGAVVSQFWPDAPPSRRTFPMRNAVMSGMTLATVIIEATHTSGSRMQARLALAHGRPVILAATLLEQDWARELAARPGTHVASTPSEVAAIVDRLTSTGALTP
jgi:DNA processing protein